MQHLRNTMRTLASAALVLAICGPAAAASPRSESSVAAKTLSAALVSVSADSPTDVWAVGTQVRKGQNLSTLVLHGDGSSWSQVEAVNPSDVKTTFSAVKALAPDDVWAVGSYFDGSSIQPLAEHWDGSEWTQVDALPGEERNAEFFAVDATGPDDVWAVGRTWTYEHYSDYLVEHWDGTEWKAYSINQQWDDLRLTGVVALSETNAWAVGYLTDDEGTVFATSHHWDGTSWRLVEPRACSDFDDFCGMRGVDATPRGGLWAAGDARHYGPPEVTHITHYAHGSWTNVPAESHGAEPGTFVRGVSAVKANDVWMIGDYDTAKSYRVYMLHWDGSVWSQVFAPSPGGTAPKTGASVSALASDDAWAVGSWTDGPLSRAFVEHWDGTSWSMAFKGLPS